MKDIAMWWDLKEVQGRQCSCLIWWLNEGRWILWGAVRTDDGRRRARQRENGGGKSENLEKPIVFLKRVNTRRGPRGITEKIHLQTLPWLFFGSIVQSSDLTFNNNNNYYYYYCCCCCVVIVWLLTLVYFLIFMVQIYIPKEFGWKRDKWNLN